ncbi:MAG: antibiotic biosynthesis monooxygenase family protein [Nocardioides sp.]
MIVLSRFRVSAADSTRFRTDAELAHGTLAARPGYLSGTVGRNLDDPTLWSLVTWWENVGCYRRALSSYDVKVHAVPLLSRAIDEPSAYESVTPGVELNVQQSRSLD